MRVVCRAVALRRQQQAYVGAPGIVLVVVVVVGDDVLAAVVDAAAAAGPAVYYSDAFAAAFFSSLYWCLSMVPMTSTRHTCHLRTMQRIHRFGAASFVSGAGFSSSSPVVRTALRDDSVGTVVVAVVALADAWA